MHSFRIHRHLVSWLAVAAVLLTSLAPAIAQAASARGASWIEVCTVQGSKWFPDKQKSGGAPAASHLLEHCPCCIGHHMALGLPPSTPTQALLLDLIENFPPAFLAAPGTLHAWATAQPRGPPPLS